ncbi:hypothetical protein NUW54_g2970 [Trametes sanguinea]|uniref:Uncharacterized protein n=1 Tax=Trametes sanguinea TaxID=158606 RepID=A0ACC1Q4N5_9APHY|nr:hypothetical protein NUW54_g2970 [Trametes sanguinea]
MPSSIVGLPKRNMAAWGCKEEADLAASPFFLSSQKSGGAPPKGLAAGSRPGGLKSVGSGTRNLSDAVSSTNQVLTGAQHAPFSSNHSPPSHCQGLHDAPLVMRVE